MITALLTLFMGFPPPDDHTTETPPASRILREKIPKILVLYGGGIRCMLETGLQGSSREKDSLQTQGMQPKDRIFGAAHD
jgi:hypothetical protein